MDDHDLDTGPETRPGRQSSPAAPASSAAQAPRPRNVPVDHGLSGLGLIMQLGGSLYFAVAITAMATILFIDRSGPGVTLLLLFLAGSAVRSWLHRSAGVTLLYGTPAGSLQRPLSGVNTYIWFAFGHIALAAWVFHELTASWTMTASLLLPLCAWPVALAVVTRRRAIAALAERRPRADDFGLEGASILMTILGVIGALFSAVMLYVFLFESHVGAGLTKTSFVVMAGLLLFRSILHVIAGERGVSEADREAAALALARYVSFGKVSSGVVGALLAFNMLKMSPSVFSALFFVGGLVYMLLIWPLALDSFLDRYRIDVSMSEVGVSRAPDAGLTTLGWLLLAFGSIATVSALSSVVFDIPPMMGNQMMPGPVMSTTVAQGDSPWWFVAIAGLQLWAGLELLAMGARARVVAAVYGGVATVITLYLVWPMVSDLASLAQLLRAHNLGESLVQVAQLGMSLALPVATFVLAVRGGRSVRATARYRARESE